jgi:uncharacterized small protein (DUF1192 family)
MTNTEKQAAWRARQAANKARVAELEARVAELEAEVARLKGAKPSGKAPKTDWAKEMRDRRHLRDAAVAKEKSKLDRLRKKMHKAHPDAGGSHEAFIKARAAYEKAKRG